MLKFITEQFGLWAIPTHKICFEITETAAIANLSSATKFINYLRERGSLFSLDDFGSGLSSFAYLKNLQVDYLKIDGFFVKDIVDDEVDLAMVRAINEVGHIMSKKTIAEFVENEEIFNLLRELSVDYAQGYGISKPLPLDQLTLIKPFTPALT
jgi:EAL domain-containing protein (putative c-di-GMP-specific phosphodiesterase class I)